MIASFIIRYTGWQARVHYVVYGDQHKSSEHTNVLVEGLFQLAHVSLCGTIYVELHDPTDIVVIGLSGHEVSVIYEDHERVC